MTTREGSLEAPTRHPLDWRNPEFFDEAALTKEMERIFDICHGCRRCVSLCQSFPTLFDLVDESRTGELDSVDKADYRKVVDQCYLCDLCYMTKCPYVPPHPWNVDFPHLMLRAKAFEFKARGARFRDRMLTGTDRMGRLASIPGSVPSPLHWPEGCRFRERCVLAAPGCERPQELASVRDNGRVARCWKATS